MPLPFIIAGVVGIGTAIATSKTCNRCDDIFWTSDCSSYCQSCCDKRERERREERERLKIEQELEREQERARKEFENQLKKEQRQRKAYEQKIAREKKEKREQEKAEKQRLEAIKVEKERQRIILKDKADRKRKEISNLLIKNFQENELFSTKEALKIKIFKEIDKEKNIQLKKINASQKLILSEIDFQKHVEIYIEELL